MSEIMKYQQKYQHTDKGKIALKRSKTKWRKRTAIKVKMLHSLHTNEEIELWIKEHM